MTGNQRLKVELRGDERDYFRSGYLPEFQFPEPFRCTFPNGWADVAKQEGFELPKEAQKQ